MNKEIKEILEKPNVYSFNDECYLYFGDYNKLKNYITNLQEENRKLKETNEEHRKINGDLRKENQVLVKVIDEAIEYILDEGVSFLNIAGQRTWCNKHSCIKLLDILNKLTELKGNKDA